MRLPRFTILQLLLAATLIALVLGLFTSAWRVNTYHRIEQLAFSPSGNLLAARYSGGALQVWRLDGGRPRLIAQAFGRAQLLGYDTSTMHFVSEDRLLKLECDFVGAGPGTRVRELTVSTRKIRELGQFAGVQFMPTLVAVSADHVYLTDWRNPAQVTNFRLDNLRPGKSWPLTAVQLAVSQDGRTLVALDQSGQIHAIDLESDQEIRQAGTVYGLIALSADGQTLAVPQAAAAPGFGTALVSLYDPQRPGSRQDIATGLRLVQWVGLSADGRRLMAVGFQEAEYYDVPGQRLLTRMVLDEPQPTVISGLIPNLSMFQLPQVALDARGKWLASVSGSQIVVRDLPSGCVVHVLTGGSRWLQVTIFTVGFGIWSAAWGIVARRERLRQRRQQPPVAGLAPPGPGRPVPQVRPQWQSIAAPLLSLAVALVLMF